MHRRQLIKTGAAIAALGAIAGGAHAQEFTEGNHFKKLKTAVPVAGGKKIELVEFFLFTCPYCNGLETPLNEWLAKQNADVVFRKEHMIGPGFGGKHQQFFYSLVSMGVQAKVIPKMFDTIHRDNKRPSDVNALADVAAAAGVDRKTFLEVFKSFGVRTRMNQSDQLAKQYLVEGVPHFGINGRYVTAPKLAGGNDKLFLLLDQVIAQERQRLA
jgi:protein dithiol oxidoreductase (disulfide-forming)